MTLFKFTIHLIVTPILIAMNLIFGRDKTFELFTRLMYRDEEKRKIIHETGLDFKDSNKMDVFNFVTEKKLKELEAKRLTTNLL